VGGGTKIEAMYLQKLHPPLSGDSQKKSAKEGWETAMDKLPASLVLLSGGGGE